MVIHCFFGYTDMNNYREPVIIHIIYTNRSTLLCVFYKLEEVPNPSSQSNTKGIETRLKNLNPEIKKMCTTKLYKSRECGHRWLVIDQPCGEGKGFGNCECFGNEDCKISRPPRRFKAVKSDCPWHGLKGNYDFNRVRMIEKIDHHIFSSPGGGGGCVMQ